MSSLLANQYDSDCTIWSPQGRLHQIEYAMEAVKQGSACVGLKSKKFAVLASLKRTPGKLASYQDKIFEIDEHIGIAIAGLTSDARVLLKFMSMECLNHKFVYGSNMNVGRLVLKVADKSQSNTVQYGRRPYGVGLLVIGYDKTGAHLYETCPSGNYFDYKAMAIGSRSQSAKTYLERTMREGVYELEDASLEELTKRALIALRETLASSDEEGLTSANTTLAIVGEGQTFTILEGKDLQPYLSRALDDEMSS
eukprot:TRINITY_DN74_c0_g1_i3.p1 TRINITY_DN74_c0_g1~~TRINITY_DN74_c0_g1_i3.p1  ORF type:complete len:253 (+),score=42.69 TRINITY_DN74_c0_g1_i3:49-807(+)